jgi:CheY-like chemotaxis protein
MIDYSNPADWRVLIVDDQADNIAVITMMFEMKGITIFSAKDGNEALDIFKREQPNFVITDLTMPGIDGWQLLDMLKAINKETPVFALTAFVSSERDRILAAGFDDMLSKPLHPSNLIENLTHRLQRWANRSEGQ